MLGSTQEANRVALASEIAPQLKALGDETRLALMQSVAAARCHSGACICDLTPQTELAQSTVSHHMKILVDAGLLSRAQRGKWAFYDLTTAGEHLLDVLNLIPEAAGSCLNCCEK